MTRIKNKLLKYPTDNLLLVMMLIVGIILIVYMNVFNSHLFNADILYPHDYAIPKDGILKWNTDSSWIADWKLKLIK